MSIFTNLLENNRVAWETPTIIEIALGAEINSYASADLK
jgi:coenzyme PQQ precursor peptide PqqA